MPSGEIVKSSAPKRWMTALLVFLAVGAVAIALFWSQTSSAGEPPESSSSVLDEILATSNTEQLKCEMVRLWPLPAECQFVFGR